MSMANAVMDFVLMGLLLLALGFGVRLNRQLKNLRASQADFARAVADLDRAAITAHTSLKELRKDADESQDLLHGRILAGRDVLQKLETQLTRAERRMKELDAAAETAQMAAQMAAQPAITLRPQPVIAPRPAPVDDDSYNPVWSAPKKTAAVRAGIVNSDAAKPSQKRGPFDRDVVKPAQVSPQPLSRSETRRPDPQAEAEDADMLDKVQMSEMVVANLNEMIRSLTMPMRQPEKGITSLEDDLFGGE